NRRVSGRRPDARRRAAVSLPAARSSRLEWSRAPIRMSPWSISSGYIDGHAGHEIGVAGRQEADHFGLVRCLGDAAQRPSCAMMLAVALPMPRVAEVISAALS